MRINHNHCNQIEKKIVMNMIEYDRIDNSCFDDRQDTQRTVANIRSKRSQARVQDRVKRSYLYKVKNNILK